MGEPGPAGVSVKVTGTALEMSPGLPSLTSVMFTQRVNGPLVPPAAGTRTTEGLAGESVTLASSRNTERVLDPELPRKKGLELMKLPVMLCAPCGCVIVYPSVATPAPSMGAEP